MGKVQAHGCMEDLKHKRRRPSYSCFPGMVTWHERVAKRITAEGQPLNGCLWSWCFITAVGTLTKMGSLPQSHFGDYDYDVRSLQRHSLAIVHACTFVLLSEKDRLLCRTLWEFFFFLICQFSKLIQQSFCPLCLSPKTCRLLNFLSTQCFFCFKSSSPPFPHNVYLLLNIQLTSLLSKSFTLISSQRPGQVFYSGLPSPVVLNTLQRNFFVCLFVCLMLPFFYQLVLWNKSTNRVDVTSLFVHSLLHP